MVVGYAKTKNNDYVSFETKETVLYKVSFANDFLSLSFFS